MNRLINFLLLTLTLTILVLSLATITASAANNVVFISADGKGDGSSPDSPLGNDSDYTIAVGTHTKNAFYKGLDRIKNTGGTLVIVGEVSIDTASSRVPSKPTDTLAPSEFKCPSFKAGTEVVITSKHNGVDYAQKGAKLIFDHEKCNTASLLFSCPTNIFSLNIEYRYNPDSQNAWKTPFLVEGGGHNLTIGTNVKVSSYNVKTKSEGDVYPVLLGGHRYSVMSKTNLTVRSGTWSTVIAGSFGLVDNNQNYGRIKGDATLSIEGGKIGTVIGTGSLRNPSGTVMGNLSITVTDGEIDEFYICHDYAFEGKGIKITLGKNAKIAAFNYATDTYYGSLNVLEKLVTIDNKSSLVIVPPTQVPVPPADTEAPTHSGTSTKPIGGNKQPSTKQPTSSIYELYDDDTYKYIHPKVLIGVLIVSAVIAMGFGIKYYIKTFIIK